MADSADFTRILRNCTVVSLMILISGSLRATPDLSMYRPSGVEKGIDEWGEYQATPANPTGYVQYNTTTLPNMTTFLITSLPVTLPATSASWLNVSRFPTPTSGTQRAECRSSTCRQYAELAVSSLNNTVDPCDDFYQFACGNFESSALGTGADGKNVFDIMKNSLKDKLREILESTEIDSGSSAKTKARNLYDSCINLDDSSDVAVELVKSLLVNITGGWPLITPNWNASQFDLYAAIIAAKSSGFDVLFQWNVVENPSDPTKNMINLGQSVLGLESPDPYNLDETGLIRSAYRELINDTATTLSGNNSTDRSLQIRDLMDFEKQLANATVIRNQTNLIIPLSRFIQEYLPASNLNRNLLPMFRGVFYELGIRNSIGSDTRIKVENPQFFRLLSGLLAGEERLQENGKRLLGNYIGWVIISTQLRNLSPNFRDVLRRFAVATKMNAGSLDIPLWQNCVDYVNTALPDVVTGMYAEEYLNLVSKSKLEKIAAAVKNVARVYINASTWMDTPAKIMANKKIDKIHEYFAYADFVRNETILDSHLENVNITHVHFQNVLTLSRFAAVRQLEKLTLNDGNNADDLSAPVTADARYYFTKNLIGMFAGMLQFPVFTADAADYSNFAGMGFLYAHVLTEVFNGHGSQYNDTGQLSNWWSADVSRAYDALANRLWNQYFRLSTFQWPLSPAVDRNSLVADNVAFELALTAYKESGSKNEPWLPSLQRLSPEMQFIITFAQNFCETKDSSRSVSAQPGMDFLKDRAYPNSLRVNVPLMNSVEFSRVFACRDGTNMNPSRRVIFV